MLAQLFKRSAIRPAAACTGPAVRAIMLHISHSKDFYMLPLLVDVFDEFVFEFELALLLLTLTLHTGRNAEAAFKTQYSHQAQQICTKLAACMKNAHAYAACQPCFKLLRGLSDIAGSCTRLLSIVVLAVSMASEVAM